MADREGDERFHLHLEDIKDYAVFRVDPEGRIASWNPGAERIKGYTAAEIIGQPFSVLFTPEDIERGVPELEMREALERGCFQGEGQRMRKGGERYDAEVTLRPLSDQHGAHRGFVKVTRDISVRKRIERELEERTAFEKQLIGIVSHDLRTPLSAIGLSAKLLLNSPDLGEQQAATVRRIVSSVERTQRMIGSLLDFTQVRQKGGLPLQYQDVDLYEFILPVLDELRMAHPGRELQLEKHGDTRGRWDADRIAQLLTNLVNNALEHGDQAQPVRIRFVGARDSVSLEIHNCGPPISNEALPFLFVPMHRGAKMGTPSKTGSIGLGLYIVQQIALAHGGTIETDSTERGGTTFKIRLPRVPPKPEGSPGPSWPLGHPDPWS